MQSWKKNGIIALVASLALAAGVGTALAGQSASDTGADASSAVQITAQVGWSVDSGDPGAGADSLRAMAAEPPPRLQAEGGGSPDYIAFNVRVADADSGAVEQLQLIVAAAERRVVGVTTPTSNEFFALDPNAPNFLPPPAGDGAGGANVSAARAADVPLVRRDLFASDAGAGDAAAGEDAAGGAAGEDAAGEDAAGEDAADGAGEDAAGEDAAGGAGQDAAEDAAGEDAADDAAGEDGAAEGEDGGDAAEEQGGGEAAVPGIQDVLGAVNTLLQVVNGENVPLDQVISAAGIMGQVIGLLLG
ncbi:hypothetical protein WEI85_43630 [Actinomycetes bacterium KLBMP 9797]